MENEKEINVPLAVDTVAWALKAHYTMRVLVETKSLPKEIAREVERIMDEAPLEFQLKANKVFHDTIRGIFGP